MVLNVCVPPLEDQERQSRLDQVLSCGLACREVRVVRRAEELELRPGGRLLFALVVSGYSGSDTVARQLISALNMNKSFYLPPRFALMETANAPGEALASPGIELRLARFVQGMEETFAV